MRSIEIRSLVTRRRRRKKALSNSVKTRLEQAGFGVMALCLLGLVVGVLAASLAYSRLTEGLPSVERIPVLLDPQTGPLMQPTRLYDRSGTKLLFSLENPGIPRRYLVLDLKSPNRFSPDLIRVTVAARDPDFWDNPGFRPERLLSSQPETIAEQVALNLLVWDEPPGLRRALRMRLLAAQMISQYGRGRVLEWYLNTAYYGHLAYGADSAARLYLNKSAGSLTLAESALLLASQEAPALNPIDAPQAALERQQAVLDRLRLAGVLAEDESARAKAVELALAPAAPENASPARAFARLVLNQLAAHIGVERQERGGLRVITTLDYALQLELNCLLKSQLLRLQGLPGAAIRLPDGSSCQSAQLTPTLPLSLQENIAGLSASAVIVDPLTGQVLALAGDTNAQGEGDRLLPHPPGTLLTPFVGLAGFARGISPANLTWDIPSSLPAGLEPYRAEGGDPKGPLRLRMALANDNLTPIAQLLEQVDPRSAWRLAGVLGAGSLADETRLDLIYTGGSVSPLEMAQAYAVFAASGTRAGQRVTPGGEIQPVAALYVEELDGRQVLWDARAPVTQAVLSAPLSYLIHDVLSDDPARWPSMGYPNPFEIGRPAGAKAGRVSGGNQAWAAGYTRQRAAVFWMGRNDGGTVDARLPAGLWHAFMQYMHRGLPAEDWAQPQGLARVEVCDPSGQLPTRWCPSVVSELFLTGSEPRVPDSLYQVFQTNRETGRLATVFTPPALIEEKTFLVVPAEAREWLLSAGLPLPPSEYDAIQAVPPSPDAKITAPAPYAYLGGKVSITGTAGGQGFSFFQLQAGQGLNPRDWLLVTGQTNTPVVEDTLGEWDTTGLNGLYALRLVVVRQDQTVETAVIQVTVDNLPPSARVQYPLAGQEIPRGEERTILFQAEASDATGVSRVAWYVDGRPAGESVQAPYVFPWASAAGRHTLVVKAYDRAGNVVESAPVQFNVK